MNVPLIKARDLFGRGFRKRGYASGARSPYVGAGGSGTFGGIRWGQGNPYLFLRRSLSVPRGWRAMPQYAGIYGRSMVRGWGMTPGIWQQPVQPAALRGYKHGGRFARSTGREVVTGGAY